MKREQYSNFMHVNKCFRFKIYLENCWEGSTNIKERLDHAGYSLREHMAFEGYRMI